MSKHVDAVLSDLRERSAQLATEQADINEAIAVLEKMQGNGSSVAAAIRSAPAAPARSKRPLRQPKAAPAKRAGSGDSELVERMRRLWEEGESAPAIAEALKVKVKSVSNYAYRLKWKRPPKGTTRCPHCGTLTSKDPCFRCGKPVKEPA